MKKYLSKATKNILKYDCIIGLSFLLLNIILYIFNIRFQTWFLITIISILLTFFIVGLIQTALRNSKTIKIMVTSFIIIMALNFILLYRLIFILDLIPYRPEHTVVLDNKKYVAVVSLSSHVDVEYYDYYGPFFMGINERVHGYFGKGRFDPFKNPELSHDVEYTYFNGNNKLLKDDGEFTLSEGNRYLFPEDEKVLYEKKFGDVIIRVGKVDNVLGRRILVNVLKSTDGGEHFYVISEGDLIQISLDGSKYIFFDEEHGFILSGGGRLYATNDGGKTFMDPSFEFSSNLIDYIIKLENLPYIEDETLKIKCYVKRAADHQDVTFVFTSNDDGKTWMPEK